MTPRLPRLGLAGLAALALAVPMAAQGGDKSIFVAVVDDSGAPVSGLTTDNFLIREDQIDREVVAVKPATQPICVALLADTTKDAEDYVPDIRNGLKGFVEQLAGKAPNAEISLWEFGQAAIRIKDFTSDAAGLNRDIGRLFPKPNSSSVLLEALHAASEAIGKRPCPRKAIVVLNLEPSEEVSAQQPKQVLQSMLKSRAQLWVLAVQRGNLKNPERDIVFTQLVRNGGGMREYIVTPSGIEGHLRKWATALGSQYEIVYKRPSGKPQVVQTGLRGNGRLITGIIAPQ